MSNIKRTLVFAIPSFITVLFILAVFIPDAAKYYINKTYPNNIYINGAAVWSGTKFEFHDAKVQRGAAATGTIQTITIDPWGRTIQLDGGNIEVKISESRQINTDSPGKGILNGWHLSAQNINGTIIKDDARAKLSGIRYVQQDLLGKPNEVRFKELTTLYKGQDIYVYSGQVATDFSYINAKQIDFNINIPFSVKGSTVYGVFVGEGVRFTPSNKEIFLEKFDLGTNFGIINGETVRIISTEREARLAARKISVKHENFSDGFTSISEVIAAFSIPNKTATVFLGKQQAKFNIDLNNLSLSGLSSCDGWVDALPSPKPANLGTDFNGNLSILIQLEPEPEFELEQTCSFQCSKPPIKDLFDPHGFKYTAYHPDGSTFERHTGPNTEGWVALEDTTPELFLALTTLEDPGFLSHHGILTNAIKASIVANIETGEFSRGGSTITMQLAKNLWLSRDKTILRKAYEAMLTFALESCMTKEQILEFYLNVVEFGPDVYGIGEASKYYFDKEPSKLDPVESFYLAMILPRPNSSPKPNEGGLRQAQRLIKKLSNSGFIMDGLVQ